jgi:hypothetical protein
MNRTQLARIGIGIGIGALLAWLAWLTLGGEDRIAPAAPPRDTRIEDTPREAAAATATAEAEAGSNDAMRERAGANPVVDETAELAIAGRVIDVAGEPLAGVRVIARRIATVGEGEVGRTSSDRDGRFAVRVADAAIEHELEFSREDRVPHVRGGLIAGDEPLVVLRPARRVDVLVVAAADGSPIEGASITLGIDVDSRAPRTDASGHAQVPVEGDLAVADVGAIGFRGATILLEVARDEEQEPVRVELEARPKDPRIHVRAIDAASSRPLPALSVAASPPIACEAVGGGIFLVPAHTAFGRRRARVVAPGYRVGHVDATPPQGESARAAYELSLEPAVALRGRVMAGGKPVAGARFAAAFGRLGTDLKFDAQVPTTHLEATSDDAGAFLTSHVFAADSEATLAIHAAGFGSVALPVRLPSIQEMQAMHATPIGDAGERVLDLGAIELPPGREIAGRVVAAEDQSPVAGAKVSALSPLIGAATVTARTAADGRFTLRRLSSHHVVLHVLADGFRESRRRLAEATATELEVVLERGESLRGVVVDSLGAPLPGAVVEVESRRTVSPSERLELDDHGWTVARARCGADGRFAISGLSSPPWQLQIRHGPAAKQLRLDAPPASGELTITLVARAEIIARIATEGGVPLPTRIEVHHFARIDGVLRRTSAVSTGLGGNLVRIDAVEAGEELAFELRAPGFGTARVEPLELRAGETRVIDVVLPPQSSLRGALRASGSLAPLELVRSSVVVSGHETFQDELASPCDGDGNFAFEGVDDGTPLPLHAEIVVRCAGGPESRIRVAVRPDVVTLGRGEDRRLDLEFDPPRGAPVAITLDAASYRAARATPDDVAIQDDRSWLGLEDESGAIAHRVPLRHADGAPRLEFPVVPEGRYRLRIEIEFDLARTTITRSPRANPATIEVTHDGPNHYSVLLEPENDEAR